MNVSFAPSYFQNPVPGGEVKTTFGKGTVVEVKQSPPAAQPSVVIELSDEAKEVIARDDARARERDEQAQESLDQERAEEPVDIFS